MKLTDIQIKNAKTKTKSYKLSDGEGLYLLCKSNGSKLWYLKYYFAGKEKTFSIGKYPIISLSSARAKKINAKRLLDENIDPTKEKQQSKQKVWKEAEQTFSKVAKLWFDRQEKSWKPNHAQKVWRRIEMHLLPDIGNIPIAQLSAYDVIRCVQRIEDSGASDIAKRSLQIIRTVLDYASIHQLVDHNITYSIQPKNVLRTRKVKHNPYLEETELPEYLNDVKNYKGELQTKLALKLMMLVFVRHNELLQAKWEEFNFDKAEWRIPAERMKMDKLHIVPLSKQALEILFQLKNFNGIFECVFPQKRNRSKPMSDGAMTNALHKMGYKGKLTIHGIRATASTILNEHGFNPDAIEVQQSRQDRNKVRAAYNHAKYMNERREMMQWWADFLDGLKS